MSSTAASAHATSQTPAAARAPEPGELAWIAALPCALLTLAALLLLGPPLGHLLLTPRPNVLWPSIEADPQPAEHGRFLVGLIGPPLLAALVLTQPRRRAPRLRPESIRALTLASQITLLALVVVCFAAANNIVLSADFPGWEHRAYFSWQTLLVALVLPLLAISALRRGKPLASRFARLTRETPARRALCVGLAVLYTALWLTTAINLDSSIGNTIEAVTGHILWTMDEPFAILNGLTPLVDFRAQYGQLWAYLAAAPMGLFGTTVGTYTLTMATGTGLATLALYATLRRLAGSSLVALALYLPLLATAFYTIVTPFSDRFGPQNVFILWPVRFAGPALLIWLTARHLDGARPRRAWVVFAFAGLVAVNNPDFGLAAGLASFAAIAVVARPDRRGLTRLAGEALAGAIGTVALFALLTLARSGSLPDPRLLFEYSRLYAIDGWEQLPMPAFGLYLPLFLTFAAAMVLAAVRVTRGTPGTLLTGLLAWIGVFGVVSSVYYAGRAFSMTLFVFFGPWAFAVVLLLLAVVPALAARGWRRPALPELAVLFSLGLMVCSLAQTPTPWSQLERIRDRTPVPVFKQLEAQRLVAETTHPGEKVGILTALSHRVAYDTGVVNVSPFASIESIAAREQLRDAVAVFRREGVRKLYMSVRFTRPEAWAQLKRAGFVIERIDPRRLYVLMVDRSRAASRG